ncbi:MAG: hypothetical protein Q9162_000074 [Coniocarpon cinnabarinum]
MKMSCTRSFATTLVTSLAIQALAAPSKLSPRADDGLQVNTSSGLVNGVVNSTYPDVRQFLGIPFAKPPVDNLRFMPPQPLDGPSAEPIDGTQYPFACAQYLSPSPSVYTLDAPEFSNFQTVSEDCLAVTVWTPTADKCAQNSDNDKGLPVLIWIYGGGFQTGSTNIAYQIPLEWIQRTQSHIVVSLQYRLNIFGYPNAQGLETQNPGLLDQRAAIEWIRDNIAAFGGNPEQMTTWGQSAGAFSVDFLNFAYPSDPIVKGQICDSGSALVPSYHSESADYSNFSFVAQSLGCDSILTGASPAQELACVQGLPFRSLLDFQESYSLNGTDPPLSFDPIADGKSAFANYTERYAMGPGKGVSDIPSIFGTNNNEGVSLVTYPSDPSMPPNETAARQTTLETFLCPAAQSTTLREANHLTTYRYLYYGNFTDVSPRYWLGPYHSSELPMLFGTRGQFRAAASEFETQVSEAMQDRWLSFMRNPASPEGWVEAASGNVEVFAKGDEELGEVVGLETLQAVQQACVDAGLL